MIKQLKEKLTEEELKEWQKIKESHYKNNTVLITERGGICFGEEEWRKTESRIPLSYDEFLDLQYLTIQDCRHSFEKCYYDSFGSSFKGQILSITEDNVCFGRIYVSGMYADGDFFEGKEDHVWMPKQGFEDFKEDDCLEFFAEPYRYLKLGDGKALDFAIRNPQDISLIEEYELPTDHQLVKQEIDDLICREICPVRDHCYQECVADRSWRRNLRKKLLEFASN